jgi:D-alanyl-D-alanine carboxypeptidase (penicillin-binding protein 5/6)
MVKLKAAKFVKRLLLVSIILVLLAETSLYFRPLPTLQPVVNVKNPTSSISTVLPLPRYGQAAVGATGFGVLQISGPQISAPIASVAKVMTAYSVLKQKPLKVGEQGPVISITDQDVLTYNDYYSKGGSTARVAPGEKISEYQALQALMLPSANNFADTLATWTFGSMDKYIAYANAQAKDLGLKNTHISDASGFSPQTMSSAQDLVLLGQAAIKDPVLAEIVNQKQADVPEAGTVRNVNWLLGTDSVNGIKTGNTDEALGCFLFSSQRNINGQKVTLIGAIMGAPDLNKAITDSRPIINAADKGFETVTAVKAGQAVGYYQLPWGGKVEAVAKKDLSFFVWKGIIVDLSAKLNPIKVPQKQGAVVGALNSKTATRPAHTDGGTVDNRTATKSASTEVVLAQPIEKPSWKWRIFDR